MAKEVVKPQAPQAPSLEESSDYGYAETAQQVAQPEPDAVTAEETERDVPVQANGHGKLRVIQKEMSITVGRVISRNYQTLRYEESITFTIEGGTSEEKRAAYVSRRDSIINRVCNTAAGIANEEKL